MNAATRGRRCGARQRGAVTAIMTLILLAVIGYILVIALNLAASDVYDTAAQEASTEALFLAESGLERAGKRLQTTACASLVPDPDQSLGGGSFSTPSSSIVSALCRVRVAGSVRQAVRTIEGDFSSGGFVEHFPSQVDFTANWTVAVTIDTNPGASTKGYGTLYGNAPGSSGGHIFGRPSASGSNDRLQFAATRSLGTETFTAVSGVPVNIGFYWRKTNSNTGGGRPHILRFNLMDTTGATYLVWEDTVRRNMATWQAESIALVPAPAMIGKTINRIQLFFDLHEQGNQSIGGGFDFITLGGVTLKAWREIVSP